MAFFLLAKDLFIEVKKIRKYEAKKL